MSNSDSVNAVVDMKTVSQELTNFRSKLSKAANRAVTVGGDTLANAYKQNILTDWGHAETLITRDPNTGEYEMRPMPLSDAPGKRVFAKSSGDGYVAVVGPRSRAKARHAHLLEFGTKMRVRLEGRHPKGIGGKYRWVELEIRNAFKSGTTADYMRALESRNFPGRSRRNTGQITNGSLSLTRAYSDNIDQVTTKIKQSLSEVLQS